MNQSSQREYAAFISYRHNDNREEGRQWANWLHHSLETYEVPDDLVGKPNLRGEPIPNRLYPIFRDEAELPANADLSTPIVNALQRSRSLVVLCSPGAVKSRFVADEILRFKAMGKRDRVIAAILAGEPNVISDPEKQEAGFRTEEECFPEPLRFEVNDDGTISGRPAEPIAADFRLSDGKQGWTTPEAYRDQLETGSADKADIDRRVAAYNERLELMKLKVIAGILGVSLGLLTERDKKYQLEKERRRARVLRLWLTLVGILAILAMGAGIRAVQKQRETVEILANSDFRRGVDDLENPETTRQGMALLARAIRFGNHEAARTRAWLLLQNRDFWIPSETPPGRAVVSAIPVVPTDLSKFTEVDYRGVSTKPDHVRVSADGKRVVTVIEGDTALAEVEPGMRVWKADGTPLTDWYQPDFDGAHYLWQLRGAELSADGKLVAAMVRPWRQPDYIEIREVASMERIGNFWPAVGRVPRLQYAEFSKLQFLRPHPNFKGFDLLLTASDRGDSAILEIDASSGQYWTVVKNSHPAPLTFSGLSPDRNWLMSGCEEGEIRISSLQARTSVGNTIRVEGRVESVESLPRNQLLVKPQNKTFRLLEAITPGIPANVPKQPRDNSIPWNTVEARKGQIVLRENGTERELIWNGPESVSVRNKDGQLVSRTFPVNLALVSLPQGCDWIITTTSTFVTEIWESDFKTRVTPPLNERHYFTRGSNPAETHSVRISPDHKTLLVESFLWHPPNVAERWFSLWDTESGALLNRTRALSDILETEITDAVFDDSGAFLVFLNSESEATKALQLIPPPGMNSHLPDLLESIGGVTLSKNDSPAPLPGRQEVLERELKRLAGEGR